MMKSKYLKLFVFVLILLLAACGSPPLVAPERDVDQEVTPSTQSEQLQTDSRATPVAQSTATPEVVGGSADSPLASPTSSVKPTESPTLSPTSPGSRPSTGTPDPPTQTPRPTVTPHPTQKLSTPISTVVSTIPPDIPINEYIFGTPERLQDLDDSVIEAWVPGSAEEMVVMGGDFLDTVNILTGEKQRLAQWNAELQFVNSNPVWLQSTKAVALILGHLETKQYELWISTLGKETVKQANFTNIERSFIPIGTDAGLGIYDIESKTLMSVDDDGRVLQTEAMPVQTSPTVPEALPYKVIQRSDWVAYYNRDDFIIMNLKTKATKELNFVDEHGQSLSAWDAQWSWDGSKIAVLLSKRDPTLLFKDLYVYDLERDTLQKVQTSFTRYINAVAWAPDNRYVVVNAIIGEAEYQTPQGDTFVSSRQALFLIDTTTMENFPIPFYSPDVASTIGKTLWSPDGKYIIVRYRFYQNGILTYRIEVKSS